MHQLKPTDLWALWQRGIPITQAFYRIGPRNYLEEYNNLAKTKPKFDVLTAMAAAQETAKEKPGDFAALSRNFSPPKWPEQSRFNELERHLQTNILNGLRQNILFGIGFATPRHPNDIPAIVPQDAWDHFIGWHNGKIQKGSLKMEEIRIGRTSWVEEYNYPTEQISSTLESQSGPGPKSRKMEIVAAHAHLIETRQITLDTPVKTMAHMVRKHILSHLPEEKRSTTGLSNETIRRIIDKENSDTN